MKDKEINRIKDKDIKIPYDLHRRIKKHCVDQDITLKDFVIELIDKGWEVLETTNGDTTNILYNDDGTSKIAKFIEK